ncbi:Na(+)-translocating NADH-quinone reductase subunit C [Psychrobium sp. 1_MG-2023]|uniref:Na(+)-translocating NADH-quinone reductase subunit C n=1 Tax=Psychrobium sp. 1_MG-2023 TaxID=3062624 RepID=UPI000C3475E2|nr:Na(+)-translocating NADH-quinone reductase subunit C [Psychrobium sp. 1_MG-2023]MDP2560025.1 Na(+)-translocating NADH-quinone reductase subunit C [Psychrobium sp. 1_MG-2023]PKF56313.1 Na(+)-translocating NADH-quinone reductase subunit C [Alteromonadales bacterium alter-6D02]
MSNKDSFGRTLIFVLIVSLVCSIVVAGAAVGLKPLQLDNKQLYKQTKILEASGLLEQAGKGKKAIQDTYGKYVTAKLIDLDTGEFVEGDAATYDQRLAALSSDTSIKPKADIAKINRRANQTVVYLVKDESGKTDTVVLEMRGSGLWSMMYAFVGLSTDLNTVKNVIYYDQGETPGLGGEIENPQWKALWQGKKLFNDNGDIAIKVIKGGAKAGDIHGVDGLSGATLTANGVEDTFTFWLGEEGFGPFIAKYRNGGL